MPEVVSTGMVGFNIGVNALSADSKPIKKLFDWFGSKVKGHKTTVAITGVAGAGKTVLYHYLTNIAYRQGYLPPDSSIHLEKSIWKISRDKARNIPKKKRLEYKVIPGTDNWRDQYIREVFYEQGSVDGIIHAVANGFNTIRRIEAHRALASDGHLDTIEKYRDYQKQKELEDLNNLCTNIIYPALKYRKPSWMVVALTKADLFYNDMGKAIDYYSPSSESPFAKILNDFRVKVGIANFTWELLPVSCWSESFMWNEDVVNSVLDQGKKENFISELRNKLELLCKEK